MASAHHPAQTPRYSLPPMPTAGSEFRLPSLKDLNFQYRSPGHGQEGPPLLPSGSPPVEHVGSSQSHPGRHDPTSWGRPSPTTPVPASMPQQHPHQTHPHQHQHQPPPQHQHQQHSPPLPAGHQQQPGRPVDYGVQRHDNGGYLTPGLPLSAQVTPLPGSVTIGPGSRGEDSHTQHTSKRSRNNSNVSVPRDSRSHASYPIPQNPQYSPQQQAAFHPVQPAPGPPPHEQVHQQTGPGAYSHPQYGYPPPQYMPQRAHNVQPLHPHHQQQSHGNPYPPPQQDPWEHQQHPHPQAPPHHHQHPPAQHQQQQPQPAPQHQHYQSPQPQQMNFARTTALVPQTVDSRLSPYQSNHNEREQKMSEIIKHCNALYLFADRYAQLQASLPHVQPSAQELTEMNHRAAEVVRLLEDYRRLAHPEFEREPTEPVNASRSFESNRPPKRPWEDTAQDDVEGNEAYGDHPAATGDKAQTTAEQDMEIIRTKRATSAAGGPTAVGQPKSKYRKRSSGQRATPPGKCHSCNIRETPEWRRGPDGARTLCNACGLHYAKLMRKRDKQIAVEGQAPRIDMETLRASARAADLDKSHSRSQPQASSSSQAPQVLPPNAPTPPMDPNNQSHHQGSFQVVNLRSGSSTGPNAPSTSQPHQLVAAPNDNAVASAPPPSWVGPGVQSFMRTSQHSSSSDASPR